jgi:uroporphyrinogen-III synthase
MSKTIHASNHQPLKGTRILVGRARHQAGALSAELRKRGAQVLEIPFIEIRKPKSFKPLDTALKGLGAYDWLILTSANGVEAMWDRLKKLGLTRQIRSRKREAREGHGFSFEPALSKRSAPKGALKGGKGSAALPAGAGLRIAAIGPATKNAIEQRSLKVDVVPEEYVAESVVRGLRRKVKGKRVLLVRAKVARDVIPRELRKAGARVDIVEAYETVIPESSRRRLAAALSNPRMRPHVVTFTSSSTVRNFVELLRRRTRSGVRAVPTIMRRSVLAALAEIRMASIGPVTSATLREFGLPVDIAAKEFTIPGLVQAIISGL